MTEDDSGADEDAESIGDVAELTCGLHSVGVSSWLCGVPGPVLLQFWLFSCLSHSSLDGLLPIGNLGSVR